MTKQKIKTVEELKNIIGKFRKINKKIVSTNGVFDILHVGHIRSLQESKKLGDILIVAVNSDKSVKKIKGPERPVNNEDDRAEMLASLECVDFVVTFNEDNPIKILEIIKPNVHVKGGDYKISEVIENDTVKKNGGKVVLIPMVRGYSTTALIKNIENVRGEVKYEFLGYPDNFEHNPISDIILEQVKHGPVLDIGCGNGNLLMLLKDRFDVEGFDISKVAVELARKRGLKVEESGIEDLKTKKKFNTILMIGLLVLTKAPEKYLQIASKWLDDGGAIMLTIPNANSVKNLFGIAKKRTKHHLCYPSYFEFKNLLKKNRFEILKCIGTGRLGRFPPLSSVIFYIIRPIK